MYGTSLDGGFGNDKLVLGNLGVNQYGYGGYGDDIIYGGDGFTGQQLLYGDESFLYGRTPGELGGYDRIYGGSNAAGTQGLYGGAYDDFIVSGSNNSGTITIFGDNKTADGEGMQEDEFGDN